ncbi:hypothetical protein ACFQV2_11060 [Actinokineospora soli]|uniref:Uncharacterized protein n=1 Tax=Actinokineospora soli TaxID=1048753 RepID=A0ABW2TNA3_9PSEU
MAAERVGLLPSEIRAVVRMAALARSAVSASLVAEVCGRAVDEVAAMLLRAVDVGLMVQTGGAFAFHPPLLAAATAHGLSASERARGHAALLGALERQAADVGELLFHARAAGDLVAAARYAERAVERAVRGGAPAEAVRLLHDLLDDPGLPAGSGPRSSGGSGGWR